MSVEAAFRRVRWLVGALLLVRLWTAGSLPHVESVLVVAGFWTINVVSHIAERHGAKARTLLGIVQLLADTMVVLLVAWAQHGHTNMGSADWAVLVLPAIEGAIRFRVVGACASWLVLAGGYAAANVVTTPSIPSATIAQRLTVVLLVALPVGYLADQLVAEIEAHRHGRKQAEHRSMLLRTSALGGRLTSRLDVDEILGVICTTVGELGFVEPHVFELCESDDANTPNRFAAPIRGARREAHVAVDDERLLAAAAVRIKGHWIAWPTGSDADPNDPESTLCALAIPMLDEQFVVLTARWPDPHPPPDAPLESLELFAAQAGASLHNAQVHRGLEELKDRLDHEASHDALTGLANRRRFIDELDRNAGRNRPSGLVGLLFVDLDGFKDVNDRYGHHAGNDLLVAVASRLRECVRPGDLVARLGGDEFTIILTRLETAAPAVAIAERICAVLSEPFEIASQPLHISTSVGVAITPAYRADTDDLLRRADAAMYRAKAHGKAQWMMDPGSLQAAGDARRQDRKNL